MSQERLNKIIALSADVKEIVKNYLSEMAMSYFQYDKCYQGNQRIILTSRADWLQHCIDNAYYKISYFESKLSGSSSKITIWKNVNKISAPIFSAAENYFNMHDGISLIKHQEEFTEYFHFAFPKSFHENGASKDLLNKLYKFINYFKDESSALFVQSTQNLYVYPEESIFDAGFKELINKNEKTTVSLEMKKFYIADSQNQYLTKTELLCLKSLFEDQSLSSAAENLGLSKSTIYKHVENIKDKLNCRTLFQIGEILSQSAVAHLFKK